MKLSHRSKAHSGLGWLRHAQPSRRNSPLVAPLRSSLPCRIPTRTADSSTSGSIQATILRPRHHAALSRPRGAAPHSSQRQRVVVRSSSAFVQDSADVIPSGIEDDDEEDEEFRMPPSAKHVVVVGAGVTGILSAMYMARRGFKVQVHEQLPSSAEAEAASAAGCLPPAANQHIVLSNRALLAFKELGAKLPYRREDDSFIPFVGELDVMTQKLDDWGPTVPYTQAAVFEYQELRQQLMDEAKRLYPSRITFNWSSQLESVDFDKKRATFRQYSQLKGVSISAAADRTKPRMGTSMFAQANRPAPPKESSSASKIPDWDTAAQAVQAAGARAAGAVGKTGREFEVDFDMLIGADGVGSRVRECMKKAKVYDFNVQECMRDGESFVYLADLPFPPSEATAMIDLEYAVPGISAHKPRQYLYRYEHANAPTLELWIPEPGTVRGTISGTSLSEAASVSEQLRAAYGSRLPSSWLQSIAEQIKSANSSGNVQPGSRTIQCSKFDGPHTVIIGDAAHSMTGALRQGLSCAVESVRLLNVVTKVAGERCNRAPMIFSEVRREDVHCLQTLEQMQRNLKPNALSGDFIFAVFGWISSMAWKSAALACSILHKLMPQKVRLTWMTDGIRDGRRGYHEVLKVFTRFAALPVIALIVVVGFALRYNIAEMLAWV